MIAPLAAWHVDDSEKDLTLRALMLEVAARYLGWDRLAAAADGNRRLEQEAYELQSECRAMSTAIRDVIRDHKREGGELK